MGGAARALADGSVTATSVARLVACSPGISKSGCDLIHERSGACSNAAKPAGSSIGRASVRCMFGPVRCTHV